MKLSRNFPEIVEKSSDVAPKFGLSRLVRARFATSILAPSTASLRDARDALGATRAARTHFAAVVRSPVNVGDDGQVGSTSNADEDPAEIRRRASCSRGAQRRVALPAAHVRRGRGCGRAADECPTDAGGPPCATRHVEQSRVAAGEEGGRRRIHLTDNLKGRVGQVSLGERVGSRRVQ